MPTEPLFYRPRHRLPGVAATIAVHVLLLASWLFNRGLPAEKDGAPAERIEWIDIAPARKSAATRTATPAAPLTRVRAAAPPPAPSPAPPRRQAEAPPAPPETSAPPAAQPEARSAYDMMQQARRDLGKIDSDLKKEYPDRLIRAPIDTPQKRLERGIDLAHELAPPKWYQPAKITELTDPGGYGRRRYRVVTSSGTYCMTYESNHSPDGRDPGTRPNVPKLTNCDPDEEPVKPQKW